MFPSSRVLARRILHGEGSRIGIKSTPFASDAAPQKTRRIPLALIAAAGAAGYCGIATNKDDDNHGDADKGWFSRRSVRSTRSTAITNATPMLLPITTAASSTHCESLPETRQAKLQRKKTALEVASSLQKMNTRQQVSRLRTMKDELLERWQKDEEGWRNLPSRAWPEYQPNRQEVDAIMAEIGRLGCSEKVLSRTREEESEIVHISNVDVQNPESGRFSFLRRKTSVSFAQCSKLLFDMASGLVFYQVDPSAGYALYESLAKRGHTDAMVACGIVLVEGLGIPPREHEGLAWLEKAMKAHNNTENETKNKHTAASMAQAAYELGCVYYTGIDGIVEENPEKAFGLFETAAREDHTAALYMVADCLVEGEGTERDVSRAVPLFYKAAERGHRYSRQRIRELLQDGNYPL